jgi:Bacterial pre-peptidase C-terminal domain
MLNNSFGNAIASRKSDNNQNGARPIGQLNGTRKFRGAVGIGDQADFYSFTLSGRSSFNLSLNKLKNNVDVFLQQGKQVIGRSTKGGKKPESISTTLEAGTYFVRVQQKSGNSKYRLTLNATSSDNGGGNPPPPSSPGQFRYLVQQFGVGGSRILKLNTASGVTSILAEDNNSDTTDNFLEVASLGDEIFVSRGVFDGAASIFSKGLHRVNPNTGEVSFVGNTEVYSSAFPNSPTGLMSPDALGFTPSGDLYGVINTSTRYTIGSKSYPAPGFYSFDKNTGKATLIAALPSDTELSPFNPIGDIVYDPSSGRFLASTLKNLNAPGASPLISIGLAGDVQQLGTANYFQGLFFDSNGTLNGITSAINGQQRAAIDLSRKVDGTDFLVATLLPMVDANNQNIFSGITGAG